MIEGIFAGVIQGVAEWLPVSSEGFIVFFQSIFFENNESFQDILEFALFLHLGTSLGALLYFRKDLLEILYSLTETRHIRLRRASSLHLFGRSIPISHTMYHILQQRLFMFLVIATVVSGVVGLILLGFFSVLVDDFSEKSSTGGLLMVLLALALGVTGYLQLHKDRHYGERDMNDLSVEDAIVAGLAQGLAVIPGLSRSGTTTAVLLMRSMTSKDALKVSFLMSIPLIIIANVILNLGMLRHLSWDTGFAFLMSFGVGFLTIRWFIDFAERVNMARFIFIVAGLIFISGIYLLF